MLKVLHSTEPTRRETLPCALCQHRLTGRCPGSVEAAAMHGDFLGLAAMPMTQPMEYGTCGEATLLRREEEPH